MDINTYQETIDNLATTTWYTVRTDIVDQVFKIRPFYNKMVENGRVRSKVPDGTHFEYPVRYAQQDQNIKWFGRGDTFGRGEKESLTRLIFYIKNLGTSIVRFWDDENKNRGRAKLIDYVEEMVWNTRESLTQALADALLTQSTDANAITALSTIISTTPTTGTVGGLNRSTNDYLQNNIKDFTNLTTTTSLLDEMTRMVNICSQWAGGGKPTPDLILTTREIYQDYERICRALQNITTSSTIRASLGFGELLFKNIEMFWDPACPAGCMYFINTGCLELPYDPSAWFEMTPWKSDPDSLDRVAQVVARCNLIATHFRKQGVIYNITTVTS